MVGGSFHGNSKPLPPSPLPPFSTVSPSLSLLPFCFIVGPRRPVPSFLAARMPTMLLVCEERREGGGLLPCRYTTTECVPVEKQGRKKRERTITFIMQIHANRREWERGRKGGRECSLRAKRGRRPILILFFSGLMQKEEEAGQE